MGLGVRILRRTGNVRILCEKMRALDAVVLNLRAFLHERHATENFRGLLQLFQVIAGEVCTRERSIQPFARNLHHPDHGPPRSAPRERT